MHTVTSSLREKPNMRCRAHTRLGIHMNDFDPICYVADPENCAGLPAPFNPYHLRSLSLRGQRDTDLAGIPHGA
jgi:hypothetical protein